MTRRLYSLLYILGIFLSGSLAAQPAANFSANVTSGCSPIVVQFTDLSTGNPTSWNWDLGNGTTATVQNPSTTYINPGTYTVSLTAANASGSNNKTVVGYITVQPSPIVNFSADSTSACAPKTIQFTNLSTAGTGGLTTYFWDFGDGNTSTAVSPSHTYTTPANYSVTLLVTNSAGCGKSLAKSNYIPLSAGPNADFTAAATSGCVPFNASFTNNTTGAVSYAWDFGDGNSSTQTNPTHVYTTTGTYTVRLIATNSGGCKDTITKSSYINTAAISALMSVTDTFVCGNAGIQFIDNSGLTAPFTRLWLFGDGNSSPNPAPTYGYSAPGTYTAKLAVSKNGCSDTAQRTIVVAPKPSSAFSSGNSVGCSVPFSVQFTNLSTGAGSYLWLFGDGTTSTQTSPQKTYTSLGTYTVRLVSYNSSGCTDTFTIANHVSIQPLNSANFAAPSVVPEFFCAPATVQLTSGYSLYTVTSYTWNFGDGSSPYNCTAGSSGCSSPSHLYSSPGTYTISVTYHTSGGCSITRQKTITIGAKPTASFPTTPDTVCPNGAITFVNNSSGATSYRWYFGDTDTSILANPTHIYPITGQYTVTLVAFNGTCSDTFAVSNRVTVQPATASFIPSFSCSNRLQFTFTNYSIGATSYLWKFGDGQTSTQNTSVTHTYASYGSYIAKLIVSNSQTGCVDSHAVAILAYPINAQFTANDTTICKGEGVQFTALTDTNLTHYAWSYGNGNTSGGSSNIGASTYNVPGNWTVKLVVTDRDGCKDSLIKPNYIDVRGPVANFTGTPPSGCSPLNVTFTDQSTTNGGAITNRFWKFGDGGTLSTANTTAAHSYTSGTYSVFLRVTDVNGCKDSITKTNHIQTSKPTAAFAVSKTTACVGEPITFTNNSVSNSGSALWHFGDGQTSTVSSPTHAYSNGGVYTVKLVITDNGGCKDSLTKTTHINIQGINVSMSASDTFETCPPLTVNFSASGAPSYAWTFGNGSQSTLTNPSTIYTYPGVYSVKVKGTNTIGCSDSVTKNITVLGPTGSFSYTPLNGCKPHNVSFTATANSTTSYIWDLSNGVTQSTNTPSFNYTYTTAGKFVPKLILSDGASCLVPLTGADTIRVDSLAGDFSFSPTSLCQAGTVQFMDTVFYSLSGNGSYSWTFGDGGTSTAHNPSHFYNAPGTYQVKLVIGNGAGCTDTITKTVTVHAQPTVSAGNAQAICLGQTTSVQLQATGATSYVWSPASGLSCTTCANPTANPGATTVYTVIGTDGNGCKDTNIVTVKVNLPPTINTGNNPAICPGDTTQLQASGAATYIWSPATGLICTNCANPKASPMTTTTYLVSGIDTNGCTDTALVTVTVHPAANVSAAPNQSICIGDSLQLHATGAVSYSWSPATGLSCTTCANPKAGPSVTTTYVVTGINSHGCIDTGKVTVTINPQPTVNAGNNQGICIGASAQLQATGASTYAWSPATGLSCTNCANPVATPTTTTTYTVIGTNGNGCKDTAQVTVTVNPLPNVGAGANQSICIGSSVTLTASGAATYSWSPATGLSCTTCANPVANPATTTTYTVTGTSTNGCVNTAQVTITVKPQPNVGAGTNKTICAGGAVQLQATGGTNYSWSPSSGLSCTSCANPVATPATTTTYTVIGTTNGCSDTAQVAVNVNPLPSVNAGNDQSICAGSTAQLQATGATSYTWTPSAGLSCTNCANPVATIGTTTKFIVTGMDGNGCSNKDSVIVTVNAIPNVTASSTDDTICQGTSTMTAAGATSYSWSPALNLSCNTCATTTATPGNTVKYIVTGITNGCSDTAQVSITVLPQPNVDAGNDQAVCAGNSVSLQATGGSTYTWSPANGLSCVTCADPAASPTVTTTYRVTGDGANGCTATDSVTVTIHQTPDVNAGTDVSICHGSSTTLTATGASTYTWSPSDGLSCTNCANTVAGPSENASYKVVGVDIHGCSDSDGVNVTVIKKNPVSSSDDKHICIGQSVELSASGGSSYQWTPATGLSNSSVANPLASPGNTTTYTLIIRQGDCFSDTAKITVNVHGLPTVDAGPDQTSIAGNTVQLNALGTGIKSYTWTPVENLSCTDCANPVATMMKTTKFIVTVANEWGCTASDDVNVTVSCDANQLFIANTFTPNGDGVNDRFYPQGKGISSVQRFRVFNRWGELIFDAANIPLNNAAAGWDGKFKNEPLKPDVFVYIVNAVCESGEPVEIKGDISLVR